jgi:uncharacterized protein
VIREALRLLLEKEHSPKALSKRLPTEKERLVAQLGALERPLRDRGLTSLALFGSSVRGDARSDSDVDVLVDTKVGLKFSLIDLVAVKDFLEDKLGRSVDVVTRKGLEPLIQDRVLREAETIF